MPNKLKSLLGGVLTVVLSSLLALMLFALLNQPAAAQNGGEARGAFDAPPGQNPNGMHIYIWTGLKTHPPGRHDYPQFLADWSKVLTEHGAIVDGALHPPSAADLAHTDVVVLYKGDSGYMSDDEKAILTAYIKRGGGFVSLHDSLCGPDPEWFANTLTGGAKKHGEVNYTNPDVVPYTVVDKASPIMEGMSDITLFDESFYKMTFAKDPGIHVLATAVIAKNQFSATHGGEVVPQIWTYEHTLPGKQARAFVWMQGDLYSNFNNYQIQRMLLRGIAWAAKRPVNELVDYVPPPPPVRVPRPANQ